MSSEFVIPSEHGDPVTALCVTPDYCVAGTLLGRLWLFDRHTNVRLQLSGFGDDAIKGLYVRESSIYSVIGDLQVRRYNTSEMHCDMSFNVSRRSPSATKFIMHRDEWTVMVFPGMTTIINMLTQEQSMIPFRLQAGPLVATAAATDFYIDVKNRELFLLISERYDDENGSKLKFRVRNVSASKGTTLGSISLGHVVGAIKYTKGAGEILVVNDGSFVKRYNGSGEQIGDLGRISNRDILALESSFSDCCFCFLSADGCVSLSSLSGQILKRTVVFKSNFVHSFGFPYVICMQDGDSRCFVSSDIGVHSCSLSTGGESSPVGSPVPLESGVSDSGDQPRGDFVELASHIISNRV